MAEVSENAELFERWVEALRSGEYKQGELIHLSYDGTFLRNADNEYNASGVLLDLYDSSKWMRLHKRYFYWDKNSVFWIENYVLEEIGIPLEFYRWIRNETNSGSTFKKIADLIEKQLL